jgi:hypothetical protein
MASTPTLSSFNTPETETYRFTPAHPDVSDTFYAILHDEADRLGKAVSTALPTRRTSNGTIILFGKASTEQFEAAMAGDPKPVVQGLSFACHLTERMVREHTGIDNFFRYATKGASIRGEDGIQAFIQEACSEYLPDEMALETLQFLYFRKMERDRLQYAKGEYYHEVHATLKQTGFAVKKDQSLPGQPNLVINREKPIEFTENAVVGKALKAKSNDLGKRARHAASCCGDMKQEEPGVTCVAVFKLTGKPFPNERVREQVRDKVLGQNTEALERVFFSDEIDGLIEFCHDEISYLSPTDAGIDERKKSHDSLEAW